MGKCHGCGCKQNRGPYGQHFGKQESAVRVGSPPRHEERAEGVGLRGEGVGARLWLVGGKKKQCETDHRGWGKGIEDGGRAQLFWH